MARWIQGSGYNKTIGAIRENRAARFEHLSNQNRSANGYGWGELEAYTLSILSKVKLNDDIPDGSKYRLIASMMDDISNPSGPDADVLIRTLQNIESSFLARNRPKKFSIITSISITRNFLKSTNIGQRTWRFNNTTISFYGDLPKKYVLDDGIKRASSLFNNPFPKDYSFVVIHTTARTRVQAIDDALRNLDILRGIWSLTSHDGQGFTYGSGRIQPFNSFCVGPVHLICDHSGKVIEGGLFYNQEFTLEKSTAKQMSLRDWKIIIKNTEIIRNLMSKSVCSKNFENGFERFAKAMDEVSFRNCLIRLWGVVEEVSLTGGHSYDDTIKRFLVSYKGPSKILAKGVLNTVKEFRNNIVHADYDDEVLNMLIRGLSHELNFSILKLLGLSANFKDKNKYIDFLDLTQEPDVINSKLELLKYAKKYRNA